MVGAVGPHLACGVAGVLHFLVCPGLSALIVGVCAPILYTEKDTGQAFGGGVLLKEKEHDG